MDKASHYIAIQAKLACRSRINGENERKKVEPLHWMCGRLVFVGCALLHKIINSQGICCWKECCLLWMWSFVGRPNLYSAKQRTFLLLSKELPPIRHRSSSETFPNDESRDKNNVYLDFSLSHGFESLLSCLNCSELEVVAFRCKNYLKNTRLSRVFFLVVSRITPYFRPRAYKSISIGILPWAKVWRKIFG